MLDKNLRKDVKKRKLFKKVLKKKKIAPRAKNKWELKRKKKSLIYFIYVAWWVSVEALRNFYWVGWTLWLWYVGLVALWHVES